MPWLPLLAAAALAAAAPGPAPADPSAERWVTSFYVHQRADVLEARVTELDRAGTFARESARRPFSAFLSILFRRPDVQAEELVARADVSRPAREAMLEALWIAGRGEAAARIARARELPDERYARPAPDLLALPLAEPSDLDMMWGAFLASGDVAYPRRIVDRIAARGAAGPEGRADAVLVAAAEWSLASNARQHEPVLRLVREERARRSGPVLAVLERIVRDADAAAGSVGRMTKVVTRAVSPEIRPGTFSAEPRTLYRIGERYARAEEAPDREEGIHGLIVVAEPDVWMVNLLDGTGRHLVDPGPTFAFRAPIVPPELGGAPAQPRLEFGLEYEFLRARGVTPARVREGGREVERFVVRVGDAVVTLDGEPGKERPRRLRIEAPGAPPLELEYVSYERDLPPRLELFERPEGIRFDGAPRPTSPPSAASP